MLDKIKIGIYKNRLGKKVESLLGFDSKTSSEIVQQAYDLYKKTVDTYAKNNNLSHDESKKKIFELLQEDKDIKDFLEKQKSS
ncbi:hypothetical protein [Clostridium cellulovorans]|uniref:Uncharacterized protein n=1 Tax=Clostridium cellulovorans (strain ATCC 35296 / DSM 3052 / OCM 3 / 743B) TaxID=573061 RepID=D9SQ68_CLOC7|nr:hypothetical protein [Clostridium cellulovorans]ADL50135.1 hypothetical protein Clocel_0355 [Clostridium cellulovorans 743B]